ncbi:hypothetical protein GDO86_012783 [Hymenochirus boettgeri]|uniref:Uncharacterized protein n=1 Tax=Hymenochirus boettgeri TaxID=247094 RepID=A0A8T2IS05_9PIPI|nr:hypothetical protein GDO86_012783 [Hymenochirus boettgeri]
MDLCQMLLYQYLDLLLYCTRQKNIAKVCSLVSLKRKLFLLVVFFVFTVQIKPFSRKTASSLEMCLSVPTV